MALGELNVKPVEFWTLTSGELFALIRGYVIRNDIESSNHRRLLTLTYNVNRGRNPAKTEQEIWKLALDMESKKPMGIKKRTNIYAKIIQNEIIRPLGKIKTE